MTVPALGVPSHVGMVVEDLALAKDQFGAALGVEWDHYDHIAMTWCRGGQAIDTVMSVAYSKAGSPNIELIQEHSGGLLRIPAGNHIGFFADDIPDTQKMLEAQGMTVMCELLHGNITLVSYMHNPHGLLVEISRPDTREILGGS
jgi:hypothetical protein